MAAKNNNISTKSPLDDTHSAWTRVKKTIKPLKNNKKQKVYRYTRVQQEKNILSEKHSKKQPSQQISPSEFKKLFQNRQGDGGVSDSIDMGKKSNNVVVGDTSRINKSHARKLKSGDIPIDAVLDLHGMTQQQAFYQVDNFISMACMNRYRKVRIITGKGKGILQNALPEWLSNSRFREHILTTTIARPEHGGSGAYYVLLKK